MPRKQKVKAVVKEESPRRVLTLMMEKADAFRNSLNEAIDRIEGGEWDDALSAIGEAERALDKVGGTLLEKVCRQLEQADDETEAIRFRMNR